MAERDSRPNPDELLARIKAEEKQTQQGKLKIFLGYAAGVGKTYAMLEAASQRRKELDVAIAFVETHGRAETEALLEGFEIIPRQNVIYRGVTLTEMDLDAVLKRHPRLAIVDELAHTNAAGSRHLKRYQDVEELLDAGIDVYTTLNIQHVESLRDVVAQVTEIWMRETVPDSIIDKASEIELVDLPPDELIKRLKEGKVYVPEQIASATEEFFRINNLAALRELTMRTAATQVDEQMRSYMEAKAIRGPWTTAERILVSITPDTLSTNLVRSARRLAAQLGAEWSAVYVETPDNIRMSPDQRDRLEDTLQLAGKLGAEVVTLQEESVASAIAEYAKTHKISKIVVGKPLHAQWQELLRGSIISQIISRSENFDVYVIKGRAEPTRREKIPVPSVPRRWRNYLTALGFFITATLFAELLHTFFNPTNLVMIYILSVVLSAVYLGPGPSIMLSVVSVLTFDFFFVRPVLSFAPADIQYTFTLITMLAVSVVISYLASQFRRQTALAWQHERQTASLFSLSRDLAVANDLQSYIRYIINRTKDTFGHDVVIYLPDPQNKEILKPYTHIPDFQATGNDIAAALWSYQHQKIIGFGTDTLPSVKARFLPLVTARGVIGVISLLDIDAEHDLTTEQERLLEAYADLAAVALEGIL